MPPLNVSGECVWGLIVRFYNIILLFRISKKNSISVYIFKDKLVIIIRPCFLNRISNYWITFSLHLDRPLPEIPLCISQKNPKDPGDSVQQAGIALALE